MDEIIRQVVDPVALVIGYAVMVAGGIGLASVLLYWPINYAWRRYGDVRTLASVMREARRQGASLYKPGGE